MIAGRLLRPGRWEKVDGGRRSAREDTTSGKAARKRPAPAKCVFTYKGGKETVRTPAPKSRDHAQRRPKRQAKRPESGVARP